MINRIISIGDEIMPRVIFGETLVELGQEIPELVVLDADVGASTQTALFRDAFPSRFYQMGIAEANMVGVAAGLSTQGWIPFVSTFAIFLTKRAGDQIRNSIAYPKANVKLNGAYGGIPTGKAGATHSAIEDISVMRAIPGMPVIVPADPVETRLATRAVMKISGPVYLRTVRCPVPTIFSENDTFEFGKARIVHEGKDGVVISTGMMTPKALIAAENLKKRGVFIKVIHMGTVKPLDREAVLVASREFGQIITVENHSIIGGLGDAVCALTAAEAPCKVTKLGVKDLFPESGENEALFSRYGMNTENIEAALEREVRERVR
ncbi:MAG: transketolase family protein [Spirochaetales bacterium]|nr:transketolase family protein [Spirochaetales bacterium]